MTRFSKLKSISDAFRSFLYTFDKFGEPVSLINMNGKTTVKSKVGGACGLTVFFLIFLFTLIKFKEMIELENPTIYQVTQSLDLMAESSPSFNLAENNFTIGWGAYGYNVTYRYNEDLDVDFFESTEYVPLNVSALIEVEVRQAIYQVGGEYG